MLELFFELLLYTIPQTTGRAIVYALTLGRARCEDETAKMLGFVFWLLVCFVVGIFLIRV